MKEIMFMIVLLPLTFTVVAQSAFVPMGGTSVGSAGSVTYSLGQVAVQSVTGGDKSVTEGVQQPYEIQTVGVDNYEGVELDAMAYPNPTQDFLNLRISNYEIPEEGLIARLYDVNGRLLKEKLVTGPETRIDMGTYASSSYQLVVTDGKRRLKTFKVVKSR